MKALTKVPASLLRDLKAYAWNESERRIAFELLIFDPATTGKRTALHLAHTLAVVATELAKVERTTRGSLRGVLDARLMRVEGTRYTTDDLAAADVIIHESTLRATGALRVRVERVMARLMLGVRGGRMPASMAGGSR